MELDAAVALQLSNVATKDDLLALGKKIEEKYHQQVFVPFSGTTDGTGKAAFRVFDVPDGMQFYPSRYIVWSDAHNPSTGGCFQSVSCYGGIYHGLGSPVNLADYFPPPDLGIATSATPNIIPYYKEFNKFNSPEFQSPDNVFFQIINGPVTTNLTLLLYGWLEEIREGARYPKRSRFPRRRRKSPPVPILAGLEGRPAEDQYVD